MLIRMQGDQIGRFFACWANVYHFGQYFESHNSGPNFLATFFEVKYKFGDKWSVRFFHKNSSGRPVGKFRKEII
jgi:hypothetical protein